LGKKNHHKKQGNQKKNQLNQCFFREIFFFFLTHFNLLGFFSHEVTQGTRSKRELFFFMPLCVSL
jgi:hypothetical protein